MSGPKPWNSGNPNGSADIQAQIARRALDSQLGTFTGATAQGINAITQGMGNMNLVHTPTPQPKQNYWSSGRGKIYRQKRVNKSRRVSNRRRRNKSIRRRKN
jgi:hypothetical protein